MIKTCTYTHNAQVILMIPPDLPVAWQHWNIRIHVYISSTRYSNNEIVRTHAQRAGHVHGTTRSPWGMAALQYIQNIHMFCRFHLRAQRAGHIDGTTRSPRGMAALQHIYRIYIWWIDFHLHAQRADHIDGTTRSPWGSAAPLLQSHRL